ncbi:hypothetical protein Syun_001843 [Stephania yunnanensis]|uniref:Uncharacterized protein n=1 Tax=Stephania yunnanensis TaxID=152371 RepID=A0AAP0Q7I0_9MAGN
MVQPPSNHFDKELGHSTTKLEPQSHIAFGEELIDSCGLTSSDNEGLVISSNLKLFPLYNGGL